MTDKGGKEHVRDNIRKEGQTECENSGKGSEEEK